MIVLTFRPLSSESAVTVRASYFRICADLTLRGPDNGVTASYADGLWQLRRRQHRAVECHEAIYLRVTTSDGRCECIGPYQDLSVTGGAIFSNNTYLGAHTRGNSPLPGTDIWREIALLSHV